MLQGDWRVPSACPTHGVCHLAFAGYSAHLVLSKFVREQQGLAVHAARWLHTVGGIALHKRSVRCGRLGSPLRLAWPEMPWARSRVRGPLEAEGGAEEGDPHRRWALSSRRTGPSPAFTPRSAVFCRRRPSCVCCPGLNTECRREARGAGHSSPGRRGWTRPAAGLRHLVAAVMSSPGSTDSALSAVTLFLEFLSFFSNSAGSSGYFRRYFMFS